LKEDEKEVIEKDADAELKEDEKEVIEKDADADAKPRIEDE
jgi:hypothetical protein